MVFVFDQRGYDKNGRYFFPGEVRTDLGYYVLTPLDLVDRFRVFRCNLAKFIKTKTA
jgi:hypothetical protein